MSWRAITRIALRVAIGLAIAIAALVIISIGVVHSARFQNFARGKIVDTIEESTGGRVEIAAFRFDWWGLHAHLENLVVHGTEPRGAEPLFHAASIDLRLKLLAGLKKIIDLNYLGVDRAAANVIVFPDGSTNVPQPKAVRKANRSALETVVDLAIGEFEITRSSIVFADQSIPLSAHGQDLQTQLFYRWVAQEYQGRVHIGRLRVAQGAGEPLDASLDIPIEIGKDKIDVKDARLATESSQVVMNAAVSHLGETDSPAISARALAHISLNDVERAEKLGMKPCMKSTLCFADADVEVGVSDGSMDRVSARISAGETRLDASIGKNRNTGFTGKIAMGEIAKLFGVPDAPQITSRVSADVSLPNGFVVLDARISPGQADFPLRGEIHGRYDTAAKLIEFRPSRLRLAHSQVEFAGILGKHLDADLQSTNLGDFSKFVAVPVTILAGGKLAARTTVEGAMAAPRIAGTVAGERFAVSGRAFDRLNATFTATPSGITVADGSLTHATMLARFSGSVGLREWKANERSAIQIDADLRNGDIADALALAGETAIPAKGALTGSAHLHGTIANPLGSVQLDASNGSAYDQPFDGVSAQVELADRLIKLQSFSAIYKNARLDASGNYTHARDRLDNGEAQLLLDSKGLDLAEIAAIAKQRPGLVGALQLHAAGAATIRGDQVSISNFTANVRATGLREASKNYGDLTASIEQSGAQLRARADSNLTGASIRLNGSATLPTTDVMKLAKIEMKEVPITADVEVKDAAIESVLALIPEDLPLRGRANVTAHISGALEEPAGSAQLSLTAAAIYGEPVDSVRAEIRVANRLVELQNLTATAPAGSLRASATFTHPDQQFDHGEITVKAEGRGLRAARIQAVRDFDPLLDGTITVAVDGAAELSAGGEIEMRKLDGHADATGISYSGKALGDATMTAQTRNGAIALEATSNFAKSQIRASGEAKLTRDLPLTATLNVANLRYSNLRDLIGGETIRPDFEAVLDAQASVRGSAMKPAELNGRIEVPRLEITTKLGGAAAATIALKNDGAIAADYSQSTLRIEKAHVTGPASDINVSGTAKFGKASAYNLALKGSTDLKLLEQIDREIHASGAIAIDALVRGSGAQPALAGSVQFKSAEIHLDSIPNGISNANGTIALRGQSASITNFTAESGGGKVTLTGFATHTSGSTRYSLHATAAHVRTRYQGLSATNSADLNVGGTFEHGTITGTLTVERVGFNPESDIGSLLAQITGGSGPATTGEPSSAMLSNVRLDVRVRTAPDARFQTTFAQALEAEGEVNLTGTLAHPGMVGRVTISQGDIVFFGNEYLVNQGVISFYNSLAIEPQVNLSLQTTVTNISVTLTLRGPIDNLKLSYVSDPPLEFDEIVALLAEGKRPSSDPAIVTSQAPAPQQSVGEIGASAIVSQAVASPLAGRLQRVFGVSQLRIDPTFTGGSALPTARLSLQQRVSNAITFTYSQDLSQSNSELIRVEWALTPKFSAVATRDENGIFGVDFFYKIRFR